MTRNTWRNIFVGIIFLTIPCYLFAIGIYFIRGGGTQPTPTRTPVPSWTPINVTELALTDPSLIVTSIVASPTPLSGFFTPIVPTSNNLGLTPVFFSTATQFPTRFVTSTPTTPPPATAIPTSTTAPVNTQAPPPTADILLPPTNTASP